MEGFIETDMSDYEDGAGFNGLNLERVENDCIVEKTISIIFTTLTTILMSKFIVCVCVCV